MSQRLSKRITLRLPAETAGEWRRRADASEKSLSDWLRERVDGSDAVQTGMRRHPRRLRTLTADPDLLRQLAAMGNNLNQMARAINSVGLDNRNVTHLITELAAIQRELHRLSELPRYDPDDQGEES